MPPTDATSATPGTVRSSYLRNQSCSERSWEISCLPVRSINAYSNTQPTPVASGPSAGRAPRGSRGNTCDRYSSTRERAQYGSVPSLNKTYTNESPNCENPRTVVAPGTDNIAVVSGYVT